MTRLASNVLDAMEQLGITDSTMGTADDDNEEPRHLVPAAAPPATANGAFAGAGDSSVDAADAASDDGMDMD